MTMLSVAQDLTKITNLLPLLDEQAEHSANDRELPGGNAMVVLASVANLERWAHQVDAAETAGRDTSWINDEDEWEPPLQTLVFWTEQWRADWGKEIERPTVATEIAFLRQVLEWAYEHEVHWDDFATDIRKARIRLENVVHAGTRVERGVPCMYDECKGKLVIRKMIPTRDPETGLKMYRQSDWHCPSCKRSWDEDAYAAMKTAAEEQTKFTEIAGDTWCTADYAARKVERPPATVRVWMSRGLLTKVCIVEGRRKDFISLTEVREQDRKSSRRKAAA